ncbi:D-alanyl-D-alanine carboxypeptidase [Ruegeria sp. SCSIO 43209]|uniref:D-alanyl-D-alanine carboxypeptidase family protein n=1 Tax=Ruegeria sp. SCSIO 43209 TaxID=2793010 RepID=UPI001CA99C33|nr:D-alanyl-D-alanine carboxypeptidase family protein [Ruegeria sp. SCSIO 43209]UAB89418.1 D-alanyl-D-alanine carboxypeptidase [Ruegeria sp. SCSIO 43209]
MGLLLIAFLWLLSFAPLQGMAAPYAAMVIDARTGEVLHSRNADTRLHPASLTKMMTLYIAFEAVRNGEITLDTQVRITKAAAAEPPSKLGLRTGQRISFRYLIRAAAVKSANDAATAIGIALSGSEAAFARRMTRTAKAMGMSRTTFKNAHGLTESGHLSTARDMTTLGRHLLYDYPQYYNLFSRQSTNAGIKTVPNTNRRLLAAYRGADGIKTGYTRAAGFNLVASAKRKDERIIATVFGGKSGASRNARVAELLDMGFRRAPSRAPIRKPARPVYAGNAGLGSAQVVAQAGPPKKSLRPVLRPVASETVQVAGSVAATAEKDNTRIQDGIAAAIAAADIAPSDGAKPSENVVLASVEPAKQPEPEPEVVTRLSTSGGHLWGVNVGRYTTRYEAEKVLLKTALSEMTTLEGTLRKVNQSSRGFDATFQGMTREQADLACRRLQARNVTCFMIGPS